MYLTSVIVMVFVFPSVQAKDSFTREEQMMLVAAHNSKRSIVKPPAANMRMMRFSEDLAKSAQDWANKCVWDHGKGDVTKRQYKEFGQNIWAGTGDFKLSGSVLYWDSEKTDYNFETQGCTNVCGHYTQMVWAKSNLMGCAVKKCATIRGLLGYKDAHIVVCNYHDVGNHIGVKPYKKGASCSQCPPEASTCYNNLCAKEGDKPHINPRLSIPSLSATAKPFSTSILMLSMAILLLLI